MAAGVAVPERVDVLIAGAGPAGSTAAVMLARSGLRVLLADPNIGTDDRQAGCYDLLLTGLAVRGLAALGIVQPLGRRLDRIVLRVGTATPRVMADAGAVICDRHQLSRTLWHAASTAGAQLFAGAVTSVGHDADGYLAHLDRGGAEMAVSAQHAIIAVGSADPGSLAPESKAWLACAQRFTGAPLRGRVLLVLPAPAAMSTASPGCAWALPGSDHTITVATASPDASEHHNPAGLMAEAVQTLAAASPRFAKLRPAGQLVGSPLNTGFAPSRVGQSRCLLAGDAAGLVNPFTGEGISYAIHSGLLAARAIAAHRDDPKRAWRHYRRSLAATFVGYFETARHASRRYHLAWRILAAGAESDHPFFAKGRRAILMPDGFSGLAAAEQLSLTRAELVLTAPFLVACDEVAISAIRREWPFLARLAVVDENPGKHRLRPAIPFFAALLAEGRAPDPRMATVAAAIELAMLGVLALLGPVPPRSAGRGVDWALASTVLAADFLLAQASKLIADSAPGVSWSFSDWLTELAALRAGALDPDIRADPAAVYSSLMEFPARIGAQLGGGTTETVRAMRDFGHHCGRAFLHAEDVLALRGERTRLDATLAGMLAGRLSAIPASLGGKAVTAKALTSDPELKARSLAAARAACRRARRQALTAIKAVPDPRAVSILREFIEAVAAPANDREPSRDGILDPVVGAI